jgi:hypothetical protein
LQFSKASINARSAQARELRFTVGHNDIPAPPAFGLADLRVSQAYGEECYPQISRPVAFLGRRIGLRGVRTGDISWQLQSST